MKLLIAMKKAFQKDGQTLQEFNNEMKALTTQDRAELAAMFDKADPEWLAKYGVTLPVDAN